MKRSLKWNQPTILTPHSPGEEPRRQASALPTQKRNKKGNSRRFIILYQQVSERKSVIEEKKKSPKNQKICKRETNRGALVVSESVCVCVRTRAHVFICLYNVNVFLGHLFPTLLELSSSPSPF